MTTPIIKSLEVPCDAAAAFDTFVGRFAQWWPLDSHAASAAAGKRARAATIEPRVGGRVYETMHDGTIDLWGEVLEFEPGAKLVITWHPGTNKGNPTRVTVVFEDAADDRARVTLTHSGWEIWADRADDMRGNYDSGWDVVLGAHYTAACDARATEGA